MHTKRTTRKRSSARVKLTPRDKAILQALRDMKFLRTSQIAALCFGRLTSTVRLRLRKLLDAGLIKAWVTGLDEENVYSLDRKGVAFFADDLSEDSSPHVPRRLERRLTHLTTINDFRINLTLRISAEGGQITEWQSDWQLKQPGVSGLVPDALFRLRFHTQERTFALEVDLGGEPAKTVFAEKLRRYVRRQADRGLLPDTLLVVTTTTRRLTALLETAADMPGAADYLFTLVDKTSQESILANVWTSPRLAFAENGPAFVSLLSLYAAGALCHG